MNGIELFLIDSYISYMLHFFLSFATIGYDIMQWLWNLLVCL